MNPLNPISCRMARAALNWSIRDLARYAGLNYNTIVRFEGGKDPRFSSVRTIETAFTSRGVQFVENGVLYFPKGAQVLDRAA